MIATIINYCTNDYRFLSLCIDQVKKFSHQIIIPVADRFFDGTEENRLLLSHSYKNHPESTFIQYTFDNKRLYGLSPSLDANDPDFFHYCHSTSRYIGYHFIDPKVTHLLFLDVDEIPDGDRFVHWLQTFPYADYTALRFMCHFYFRSAAYQSLEMQRIGLLVKKEALFPETLLDVHERKGTFHSIRGSKIENVLDEKDEPLFHHYSWVKTTEEMFKKVVSWGHHLDRDWKSILEEELSSPFRGKDLIWGFTYKEVTPFCDPLQVVLPNQEVEGPFSNVTSVDREMIYRRGIERLVFSDELFESTQHRF